MNWFQLREWWRYQSQAMGRHGVHSPFVYQFIEQGLKPRMPLELHNQLALIGHTGYQYGQLSTICRSIRYLKAETLEWAGPDLLRPIVDKLTDAAVVKQHDRFPADFSPYPLDCVLLAGSVEEVEQVFEQRVGLLPAGCYLMLTDIHSTEAAAAQWARLCRDLRINLSIDLWYLGLLFYRGDFKERQHFVLKHWA